jgi:peptidoglycan/xylan/chitin deacetylase (PgdA/CDA1 family)
VNNSANFNFRDKLTRIVKQSVLSVLIATRSFAPRFFVKYALRLIRMGYLPSHEKGVGKVTICRYKGGAEAACCISIDFDCLYPEKLAWNHEGTLALLELSNRYEIPLTWAICGETALGDKIAYDHILQSKLYQEIAVHTYSHRNLADPACSDDEAELEIKKCTEVLSIAKKPTTFIFPWNKEAKFHVLENQGFTAYRSKNRQIGYPSKKHGLWNVPPVCYLDQKTSGSADLIKKYIDLCIVYGSVIHLWAHPWSLCVDGNMKLYFENTLEPIFQYIAKKRDNGILWVCTMNELVNYCEAHEKCGISDYKEDVRGIHFQATCRFEDRRYTNPPRVSFSFPVNGNECSVNMNDGHQLKDISITRHDGRGKLYFDLSFNKPEMLLNVHYG